MILNKMLYVQETESFSKQGLEHYFLVGNIMVKDVRDRKILHTDFF